MHQDDQFGHFPQSGIIFVGRNKRGRDSSSRRLHLSTLERRLEATSPPWTEENLLLH